MSKREHFAIKFAAEMIAAAIRNGETITDERAKSLCRQAWLLADVMIETEK